MLIFRALNFEDASLNPEKNGLFSKKAIYNYAADWFGDLNPFFMNCHSGDIILFSSYRQSYIEGLIHNIYHKDDPEKRDKDIEKIINYITTANGHIINGKHKSNWISFTSSIDTLKKYYLDKNGPHKAVAMFSNIDVCFDRGLLALDLSDKENIEKNGLLINKPINGMYKTTDINTRPVNYAVHDKQFVYYNHVPAERLIMLTPLEIDMLYNGMIDEEYFKVDQKIKYEYESYLYLKLHAMVYSLDDDFLLHVFNMLYDKNISLSELTKDGTELEDLIEAKREILSQLDDIPFNEKIYKRKMNRDIRVLEEE